MTVASVGLAPDNALDEAGEVRDAHPVLQMNALNVRARQALGPRGPTTWGSLAELERVADEVIGRLRRLRAELASGPGERLSVWLDEVIATDAVEYLDRPTYPESKKLRQVRLLHLQNRATRSYQRFHALLKPAIEASAAARADGRARVLELACGYGELTLELARIAARDGTPVTLTGSDVVEAFVEDGNRRARAVGSPVSFRRLDALDMSEITPGEFDIVFIAQSIHHFSPGQLARILATAADAGVRHFIGVDGHRSMKLLAALPLLAAVTLHGPHTHDAFLSARKFYAEPELALIAQIAAPQARSSVRTVPPGFSVLQVAYSGSSRSAGARGTAP